MNKQTFDAQLKRDAITNNFKIEGDFIVFDKTSNLNYQIIPFFTLKNLLTKNPISSYTKLSKTLLLWLHKVRQDLDQPLYCNSGYRSLEYNSTFPTSAVNSWHTKGLAMDVGTKNPKELYQSLQALQFQGEIGIYDTFVHIAPTGKSEFWDNSKKKNLLNYLDTDQKRNYTIYVIIALSLFFLLRKR